MNKDKITDEMVAVIQKNLPGTVANELRDYLFRAKEIEAENESLKSSNESGSKRLISTTESRDEFRSKYEHIKKQAGDLDEREHNLMVRTTKLDLEVANQKIEALCESKGDIFSLVQTFVRNPVHSVKKTFEKTKDVPIDNNGYVSNHTSTETDTTTTEEETFKP